jgi:DNA-binding NarL/FixJ family response regulator
VAELISVLLADDHPVVRQGLRTFFETLEDVEVAGEATNGAEAVELAQLLLPDIVLMDLVMPELDGVEATRRIRETDTESRVLMLTMHADKDVLADAIRAGASGYLVKDCSTEEIAEAVKLAANGETHLSPQLASSMLAEAHRLDRDGPQVVGQEPLITKREEEVLQLIADGASTTEVAEKLYISVKTVKNHLASIYQKLDSRDRTQAVLRAVRMGIIRLGPED